MGRYSYMYPPLSGINNTSPSVDSGFYSNVNTLGASYGLYTSSRVLRVRHKLTIHNQEAFPIVVAIIAVPSTLKSTFAVSNYGTDIRGRPRCVSKNLYPSAITGSMGILRLSTTTATIESGTDTTVSAYHGVAATAPTAVNTLYIQVWAADGASLFTANGIAVVMEADFLMQGLFPNSSLSG